MNRVIKFLNFLEDSKHPCLGPHIRCLNFLGIWHPNMKSKLTRLKLTFFYFTIGFFISQYIKCLVAFNVDSLKLILKFTAFHMGVAKSCLFQKNYKRWERLISFVSTVELSQIARKDKNQDLIFSDYRYRSRKVTYSFLAFAFLCNLSIFSEPYQMNQINENGTSVYTYLYDAYTPFAQEPPGYYCTMFMQTLFGNMMSACILSWDTLVISIMIFFAGQLRMSRLYCKRVVDLKNAKKSHENIVDCHRFHISLIQYQKEFNDLISPVMFIYLVLVAASLGVCITQIAEAENDLSNLIAGCIYMAGVLVQLLLYYWHANEVSVESELVRYSSFESDWMDSEKSVQKEIALLAQATRKKLIFTAGPLNEMSLPTFIKILRASYSFFTLLNGTN